MRVKRNIKEQLESRRCRVTILYFRTSDFSPFFQDRLGLGLDQSLVFEFRFFKVTSLSKILNRNAFWALYSIYNYLVTLLYKLHENVPSKKVVFVPFTYIHSTLSTSLYEWIVLLVTHYCIHLSCNPTVKMNCEPCYVTQHCLRKFDFSKMTFRWKDWTFNRIYM